MVIFVRPCSFFPSAFAESETANDFIETVLYLQKRSYTETARNTDFLIDRGTVLTGQKSRPRKRFSRQKSNCCCLNSQLIHVLLLCAYLKPLSVLLWKILHLPGPTALFWKKFILVLK